IRDFHVTGVQTCALPICWRPAGTTWPGPAGGTTATAGTTTTTTTTTTRRATPGGPTADRDHDRRAARPAGRAPGRGSHGRVRPHDGLPARGPRVAHAGRPGARRPRRRVGVRQPAAVR